MTNPDILIEALKLIALPLTGPFSSGPMKGLWCLATDERKDEYISSQRLFWINKYEPPNTTIVTGEPEALCADIAVKALEIWKTQTKQ